MSNNSMVNAQQAREQTNNFRNKFEYDYCPQLGDVLDAITESSDNGFNHLFVAPTTAAPVLDDLVVLGYQLHKQEKYVEIAW